MDWRNAGYRTTVGKVDGSVILPILACIIVFHYITIAFLLSYAAASLFMTYRGRSMKWLICRARFWLRRGVILARTPKYWRYVKHGIY